MRTHHVIAVVAVVLVGAGVKLTQLESVQAQHVDAWQLRPVRHDPGIGDGEKRLGGSETVPQNRSAK